jgi:hypothetical protein
MLQSIEHKRLSLYLKMRIWSLHPRYLDSKGLVALWREGLLAQKVLSGKTKGYKKHPQLIRFKRSRNPLKAIGFYLQEICREADKRSYTFDTRKILSGGKRKSRMTVTQGQLEYEMRHLCKKLKTRDPLKLKSIRPIRKIQTHPLFKTIPGLTADWEKTK